MEQKNISCDGPTISMNVPWPMN